MKITKSTLKQIIKEELSGIFEGHEWGGNKGDESKTHPGELDYETSDVPHEIRVLEQIMMAISDGYDSLEDDETKSAFEEHLLQNIDMYVKKWRADRDGSPSSQVEPLEDMHWTEI